MANFSILRSLKITSLVFIIVCSIPSSFAQQTTQSTAVPSATTTTTTVANNNAAMQNQNNVSQQQFEQWLQSNTPEKQIGANGFSQTTTTTTQTVTRKKPQPLTYEQGQEVMLSSVPSNAPVPSADSTAAFNTMIQQNIPLAPQQVVQLRQQIDQSQRAAAITPNIPPKPVSTTLMINLAPGTTPPAVRLAQGYVSSLVFIDSTGTPWPIASFDIGNPKAVNIQWDGKSNILLLQAVSPYSDGDIVIRLVGLATPITLELVAGQRVVDYRVDLHISGIGPNTKELPVGTALPNSASQLLLGVLDGIAPAGSKLLTVRGADAQAWLLGERMYLRTRLTVLSPGWMGKMTSPDGMQSYELPKTSSVLVSKYGEPAELKVEGF